MILRPETERDIEAVRRVHIAAFATHPFSHQTEHLIVDALREAGALEVSLVAEVDGAVVGHVAFSKVLVGGADLGFYALGPVGLFPESQRHGVGTHLVTEGLAALRARGARGCILVGNIGFYGRFGFGRHAEIRMHGVPSDVILGLVFEGAMPEGEVVHHAAFSVGL